MNVKALLSLLKKQNINLMIFFGLAVIGSAFLFNHPLEILQGLQSIITAPKYPGDRLHGGRDYRFSPFQQWTADADRHLDRTPQQCQYERPVNGSCFYYRRICSFRQKHL
jgi:hypothetical protein